MHIRNGVVFPKFVCAFFVVVVVDGVLLRSPVCLCLCQSVVHGCWIWAANTNTNAVLLPLLLLLIILTSVSDPLQIYLDDQCAWMCHSLLDKPVEFVNDLISSSSQRTVHTAENQAKRDRKKQHGWTCAHMRESHSEVFRNWWQGIPSDLAVEFNGFAFNENYGVLKIPSQSVIILVLPHFISQRVIPIDF